MVIPIIRVRRSAWPRREPPNLDLQRVGRGLAPAPYGQNPRRIPVVEDSGIPDRSELVQIDERFQPRIGYIYWVPFFSENNYRPVVIALAEILCRQLGIADQDKFVIPPVASGKNYSARD